MRRQHILITLVIFLLTLVCAESMLRFVASLERVDIDPIYGLRPISGAPDTDEMGLRNPKVLAKATVVALGDSMTWGGNAEMRESWPLVLGEISSTTVYNMGYSGYGPVQFVPLFERAIELEPKIVIAAIYPNLVQTTFDIVYENAHTKKHWSELRGKDMEQFRDPVATPDGRITLGLGIENGTIKYQIRAMLLLLHDSSFAYKRFADITRTLRELIGATKSTKEAEEHSLVFGEDHPELVYPVTETGIETILTPGEHIYLFDFSLPRNKEGVRIARERLLELSRRAKEESIKLIVLQIPTKEEVYIRYWQKKNGKIPEALISYAEGAGEFWSEMEQICVPEITTCVSVSGELSDALLAGKRVFSNNKESHPNAAGYRIIASTVAAYTRQHTGKQFSD